MKALFYFSRKKKDQSQVNKTDLYLLAILREYYTRTIAPCFQSIQNSEFILLSNLVAKRKNYPTYCFIYSEVISFPSVTECMALAIYSTLSSLIPARLMRPSRVRKIENSDVKLSHISLLIPEKKGAWQFLR